MRVDRNRLISYSMMPYEKYDAWKASHALALEVYRITELWPKSELYGLTAQTRRAALSVPTNIAEGAAKLGPRESVDTWMYRSDLCRSCRICCFLAVTGSCLKHRNGNAWTLLEIRLAGWSGDSTGGRNEEGKREGGKE
jgi:four helix bundle protein